MCVCVCVCNWLTSLYRRNTTLQNKYTPIKINLKILPPGLPWWLSVRIHLPRGDMVWSLVQEDPTYCRATKPRNHNYWSPHALETEKSLKWEASAPQQRVGPTQQRRPSTAKNRYINIIKKHYLQKIKWELDWSASQFFPSFPTASQMHNQKYQLEIN